METFRALVTITGIVAAGVGFGMYTHSAPCGVGVAGALSALTACIEVAADVIAGAIRRGKK